MALMQASAEPTVWHYIFLPFLLVAFFAVVAGLFALVGVLIHGPVGFASRAARTVGKETALILGTMALARAISRKARELQREQEDPDDEGDPEAGR